MKAWTRRVWPVIAILKIDFISEIEIGMKLNFQTIFFDFFFLNF